MQAILRRLQLQSSQNRGRFQRIDDRLNAIQTIITNPSTVPPTQAVNLLRNGDLAHSVRTWNSPTALEDDQNKEAFSFFSHPAITLNQAMVSLDSRTNSSNQTLKADTHSTYDINKAYWDRVTGASLLNSISTIDAVLEHETFRASFTAHLTIQRIARASKYVSVPREARMFCGLWGNIGGTWQWITAKDANTITVSPSVTGTTEYRYRVHTRTDRGYSFLTEEAIITNAPNTLGGGTHIQLTWSAPTTQGIQSYDIYRFDPIANEYLLIDEVSSGANNYQDNGTFKKIVTGYPTADFDRGVAYSSTRKDVLRNLAIDGESASWDTLDFQLPIPSTFELGELQSEMWLRIGITGLAPNGNFDLRLDDTVTDGTVNIVSAAGLFSASHVGQEFELFPTDRDGKSIAGTIISVTDANNAVLSKAADASSVPAVLVIPGGGASHGVIADLFHLSTARGAVYAPHPEDYAGRPQAPASRPNGSTQGTINPNGTPIGTDGDGRVRCVFADENVYTLNGNDITKTKARLLNIGDIIITDAKEPSVIIHKDLDNKPIYKVTCKNGVSARITETQPIIISRLDKDGTQLQDLSVGDEVLTVKDGALEPSLITRIKLYKQLGSVVKYSLSPNPLFIAGSGGDTQPNGLLLHNRKIDEPIEPQIDIPSEV